MAQQTHEETFLAGNVIYDLIESLLLQLLSTLSGPDAFLGSLRKLSSIAFAFTFSFRSAAFASEGLLYLAVFPEMYPGMLFDHGFCDQLEVKYVTDGCVYHQAFGRTEP